MDENKIMSIDEYKEEKKKVYAWLENIIEDVGKKIKIDADKLIKKQVKPNESNMLSYISYFFKDIVSRKGKGKLYSVLEIEEIIGYLMYELLHHSNRKQGILAELFDLVIGEAYHTNVQLDPSYVKWLLENFTDKDKRDAHTQLYI